MDFLRTIHWSFTRPAHRALTHSGSQRRSLPQHPTQLEALSRIGPVLVVRKSPHPGSGKQRAVPPISFDGRHRLWAPGRGALLAETLKCTQAAARAAETQPRPQTWSRLYVTFGRYGQCDDGSVAEAWSEFVATLLAEHWGRAGGFWRRVDM